MFSIGDGQRKIICNYKAVESIMSRPKEYWQANSLTTYVNNKSRITSQLIFKNNINSKEKLSKYYIAKSKQLQQLKKEIQTKRLDLLIEKALEKSNLVRNYSSNYKNNINLKNRVLNKINYRFPNIKSKNNMIIIPKYSQDTIKRKIITIANNFFPERYFDEKEKHINNKYNLKKDKMNKKKLNEEYKKLYSIKYIQSTPIKKEKVELKLKKKEYQLISPAFKIYNKTNKKKFFSSLDNEKVSKKIDVGLNTMLYIN